MNPWVVERLGERYLCLPLMKYSTYLGKIAKDEPYTVYGVVGIYEDGRMAWQHTFNTEAAAKGYATSQRNLRENLRVYRNQPPIRIEMFKISGKWEVHDPTQLKLGV